MNTRQVRFGRRNRFLVIMWLVLLGVGGSGVDAVRAENDTRPEPIPDVRFGIPDVPAAMLLGIDSKQVVRPGSVRDFAINLLNVVDDEGRLNSGVALALSPRSLLLENLTREQYVSKSLGGVLRRLLLNTEASLATASVRGGELDEMKLAAGLRIVLVDEADLIADETLYQDLTSYVSEYLLKLEDDAYPGSWDEAGGDEDEEVPEPSGEPAAADGGEGPASAPEETRTRKALHQRYLHKVQKRLDQAKKDTEKEGWRKLKIELGSGILYQIPSGILKDRNWGGKRFWLTASSGLGCSLQGLLQGQLTDNAGEGDSDMMLAARLTRRFETWGLAVESSHRWIDDGSGATRYEGTVMLGAEIKVDKKTWLDIGYGVRLGEDEPAQLLAVANLQWSTHSERQIGYERP